jgi:hypothetical protein
MLNGVIFPHCQLIMMTYGYVITFFSYEQCHQHYTKRIMNIRQAKIHGETIVAKPQNVAKSSFFYG